ncbi:uncharacterized protein CDAR_284761 [Caerostris darwini]|uniref:Uncharacterized protein n=1 Tax=Caerostris darwini TaxID=1538125 RepID=A0AAV4UKG8_9ARAC|nr:uncharacterized protein CDAR_284761 [Caerostris darwini]
MAANRIALLITVITLIIADFGIVYAGGHGKRNGAPPYGLHLLLQQALRPRSEFPLDDYRVADRDAYDYLKGFTNSIKPLDDKTN